MKKQGISIFPSSTPIDLTSLLDTIESQRRGEERQNRGFCRFELASASQDTTVFTMILKIILSMRE